MAKLKLHSQQTRLNGWMKCLLLWLLGCFFLFSMIGAMVSLPIGRKSSPAMLSTVTEQISSDLYLSLLTKEFRPLQFHYEESLPQHSIFELFLQLTTQLNRTDVRTLFGHELPGFHPYKNRIIIGQADTNYSNLPVESSAPLETILEDRLVIDSPSVAEQDAEPIEEIGEKSVFIYNTHNRESFLPHLEESTNPDAAFHSEVNVTLISQQLKKALATKGIGASIDQTDFSQVLHDQGWDYWQSYQASKPVVKEAMSQNKTINYIFDLHRDSLRKENTTITIDGQEYARLFFVIGADFEQNKQNIAFATQLHESLEQAYPGISRGVVEMGGSGRNGVYNQDLSDHALLIEFGGVDNTLDELYRTVDAFAEIFASYYWDAESVSTNEANQGEQTNG